MNIKKTRECGPGFCEGGEEVFLNLVLEAVVWVLGIVQPAR